MESLFRLLFSFVSMVLLLGCSSIGTGFKKPDFKEEVETEFEILGCEKTGYGYIADMGYYKQHLFVLAYDAEDGKYLHVFNLNGEDVASALFKGRGSMEVLFVMNSSFDRKSGELMVLDNMSKKVVMFSLDSLIHNSLLSNSFSSNLTGNLPVKAKKVGNRYLIMDTDYKMAMAGKDKKFVLLNEALDTLSVYNEYPYESDFARRFQMNDFQATLDVSEDGGLFAFVPWIGAILETYTIKNEKIEPIAVGKFIEPQFSVPEGQLSWDFNENSVLGFNDVFATNDFIYTVYDGETRPRAKDAKKHLWNDKIAVFDWNCKPIRIIKTDYQIERICIDEDETTLFAVLSDIKGRYFLGRIKL